MFQSSIKKITRRLVIVSAVLCAGLWFAGCGQKEEEGKKEEDPLNVKGGELTKGGGNEYANAAVTAANLDDFISVFLSALNSERFPSGSASRGKRKLPDEYYNGKGSGKIFGDSSGYVEMKTEVSEGYNEAESYDYLSQSNKFFDFSNTNKLFLGGAFGYFENENEIFTEKYNGTINFQGAYKGKVVFDNFERVYKITWEGGNPVYTETEKSGKFYVESGGKKIDLPDDLVWEFCDPSSNKDVDLGNDKITLNTNVPVPAAPNGALTERAGGKVVSADNIAAFFEVYNTERDRMNGPRAYEFTHNTEELRHGAVSGYFLRKEDWKMQENNSEEYYVTTETMSYNDYSNKGSLYFGGGYGEVAYGIERRPNKPGKYTVIDTTKTTLNGKVHFNGEFKGTLDFQNFKYEEIRKAEYELYPGGSASTSWNSGDMLEYKLIGGKVMIGALDVTENYLDEVIRRN